MMIKERRGSALAMALVIGVVLLQFAIIYTMQARNSSSQTHHVDERVRLRYLAHGLSELALLKFQKFPSEFYKAWEYASATGDVSILDDFAINAPEFSSLIEDDDQPKSTFNPNKITLSIATMTLATADQWGAEILTIRAEAGYLSRRGASITADVVRTVRTDRQTSLAIPSP